MAVLSACGPGVPQLGKSSLDEVIGAMTLEEKAHLVVGTGIAGFSGDSAVIGATRKLVPGAAGTAYPIERLGIPAVVLADGPAGLRIDPKREGGIRLRTIVLISLSILYSYTGQELVESVGQSIGNEVLEYGADVLLAPALNPFTVTRFADVTSSIIPKTRWCRVRLPPPTYVVCRATVWVPVSSTLL